MHILLFLIILQAQTVPNLTTPRGPGVQKVAPSNIQLAPQNKNTTPELTKNSDLMTYQMGLDVGGQREAVTDLRSKVSVLEDKREKLDRPDIDSLKSSRIYAGFVVTAITTIAALMWFFKKIIWNDIIKPRLKKEFVEYP